MGTADFINSQLIKYFERDSTLEMLQDLISTIGTTIFQILRELFFVRPVLSPAWARADAPCTQTLGQFTYNYPHHDHDFAKRK